MVFQRRKRLQKASGVLFMAGIRFNQRVLDRERPALRITAQGIDILLEESSSGQDST
jgi:hypothetical protein